jgi:hypothetical protein
MGHAGEYSEPAGSNCKFRVATIRLKPSCTFTLARFIAGTPNQRFWLFDSATPPCQNRSPNGQEG